MEQMHRPFCFYSSAPDCQEGLDGADQVHFPGFVVSLVKNFPRRKLGSASQSEICGRVTAGAWGRC